MQENFPDDRQRRQSRSQPRQLQSTQRAASALESDELSKLIGTVYDCALDKTRWVDAVEHACRFLNCVAGALIVAEFLETFRLTVPWGYLPGYWDSYLDHYVYTDPMNPTVFRTHIGDVRVGSCLDVWPEVLGSPIYREWAAPQGFVDIIAATMDKSASGIATLTCVRHESAGALTAEEERRMALIVPHFRRALLIGKVIDLQEDRASAFTQALDGLTTSVFFLNASGLVVHMNASAREMLDARDPLRLVRGALLTVAGTGHTDLRHAFGSAISGQAEIDASGVAVPIAGSKGDRFTAHVLPLTSGRRRQIGIDASAVAAVFVRKATIDIPAAIGAATKLYGFTPAEARVLGVVIEVGGLAQVATILGVAHRTVQTHLEHLFEKTGSRRQAELVKLIAGYDTPVRGT